MRRFLLFTALFCLGAWIVLMLAGAVPQPGEAQLAVFRAPAHWVLMGCIALGAAMAALWRPSLRRVPVMLLHLGTVLIIVGAAMNLWKGESHQVSLPVDPQSRVRTLSVGGGMGQERLQVPLGFSLVLMDFSVEYYPVKKWNAWRLMPREGGGMEWKDIDAPKLSSDGSLRFSDEEVVPANRLTEALATRAAFVQVNESLQIAPERTPRRFAAKMVLDEGAEGKLDKTLEVNAPISYEGWRFHLSSYDDSQRYNERTLVHLIARREPGIVWVTLGIWILIGAAFVWGLMPASGQKPRGVQP